MRGGGVGGVATNPPIIIVYRYICAGYYCVDCVSHPYRRRQPKNNLRIPNPLQHVPECLPRITPFLFNVFSLGKPVRNLNCQDAMLAKYTHSAKPSSGWLVAPSLQRFVRKYKGDRIEAKLSKGFTPLLKPSGFS